MFKTSDYSIGINEWRWVIWSTIGSIFSKGSTHCLNINKHITQLQLSFYLHRWIVFCWQAIVTGEDRFPNHSEKPKWIEIIKACEVWEVCRGRAGKGEERRNKTYTSMQQPLSVKMPTTTTMFCNEGQTIIQQALLDFDLYLDGKS